MPPTETGRCSLSAGIIGKPLASLPIDALLPEIRRQLGSHAALVIQAPPGAGKTTRVPPVLLDESWAKGRKLVMLEPRRLAARAAARYMAEERGDGLGATVGYRVRMDTRVGPKTRIEVVTEGVLTRLLQEDPALEGYAAVIFDEFHERSLQADLALALCLESRAALRPDLKLIVMSATLDAAPVAKLLGDAPILTSEGRAFEVTTHYRPLREREPELPQVQFAVERALQEESGNLLVFLPGTGEIRKLQQRLEERLPREVLVAPLYGDLDNAAQDRAIEPPPSGKRKVVLATSIAETSLTIEGIRVVVDTGEMRVPRFDPVSGMSRLETVRVSRASADQRRGRAGRLQAGVCHRLWKESETLVPASTPEIMAADLADLVLELARWGATDPGTLRWLDPPPAAAYAQARELLQELGALDAAGRITPHGGEMRGLPLHPRLAHMVLRGKALGWGTLACELAAILSEKDPLRAPGGFNPADVHARLELLRSNGAEAQRRTRLMRAVAADLRRSAGVAARDREEGEAGVLLGFAYPDRLAQRRSGEAPRYVLANGRGAALPEGDALGKCAWLAVAQLDGVAREARIFMAASLGKQDIERHFAGLIEEKESVSWDEASGAVLARRQKRLGALVLEDAPATTISPEAVTLALLQAVRERGLGVLPWTPALRNLQARLAFLRRTLGPEWPDASDAALLASLDAWLAPWLQGMSRLSHLERLPLDEALRGLMDHRQRRELEEQAPTHVTVPSGSSIRVDYAEGDTPVLRVKLQEMFGQADTPRLARGKVPVMLHLLSPAQRPVQVTQDLKGFWQRTWPEVKKEMKGRYPKHQWPEDPTAAVPSRTGRKPRPR
ncbi:MAG TPA: ATP-dependent helicase HrpB [Gammaproteobacteria bacterium]|jgi:ATP-dependent helicase HrpB|nr:ATP-dependent helicase HrpB [Gammaproteobacteria bacterium]